jgi:hypothetical protein
VLSADKAVSKLLMMFDGMRGKICFADPNEHYKNLVVVDIE